MALRAVLCSINVNVRPTNESFNKVVGVNLVQTVRRHCPYKFQVVDQSDLVFQPLPGTQFCPMEFADVSFGQTCWRPELPLNDASFLSSVPADESVETVMLAPSDSVNACYFPPGNESMHSERSEPSERPRPEARRVIVSFGDSAPVSAGTARRTAPRGNRSKSCTQSKAPQSVKSAVVQFRVNAIEFAIPLEIADQVRVGSVVVTPGDRGTDIGRVVTLNDASSSPNLPWMIGIGGSLETSWLEILEANGENLKMEVQKFVDGLESPRIQIVACDFQADGGKLTVHFTAARTVRFLTIAKALFSRYRCRVWMSQIS